MSSHRLRNVVIALVVAGGTLLLSASPAHAGRLGHRHAERIALQARELGLLDLLALLVRKVVQPSGGGMDPNGLD